MRRIRKAAEAIARADGIEEAVHQLRVSFKKLRAFVRLAKIRPEGSKRSAQFSRLKQVYRLAGRLRDQQLYLHQLDGLYKGRSVYRDAVQTRIDRLHMQLQAVLKRFSFALMARSVIKALPRRITRKRLNAFIEDKQLTVEHILASSYPSSPSLHAIRKALKDILYNLSLFHKPVNAYLPIAGATDPGSFKHLLKQLGRHQDYVEGQALLQAAHHQGALDMADHIALSVAGRQWEREDRMLIASLWRENEGSRGNMD